MNCLKSCPAREGVEQHKRHHNQVHKANQIIHKLKAPWLEIQTGRAMQHKFKNFLFSPTLWKKDNLHPIHKSGEK